jgi:hypothetical protein
MLILIVIKTNKTLINNIVNRVECSAFKLLIKADKIICAANSLSSMPKLKKGATKMR